jgi:hypothetical protein
MVIAPLPGVTAQNVAIISGSASHCHAGWIAGAAGYVLTKWFIYIFLYIRGQTVQLAHKRTTLERLIMICTAGIPLLNVFVGVWIRGEISSDSDAVCMIDVPIFISTLMIIADAGLSMAYLFMFTQALRNFKLSLQQVFNQKAHKGSIATTGKLNQGKIIEEELNNPSNLKSSDQKLHRKEASFAQTQPMSQLDELELEGEIGLKPPNSTITAPIIKNNANSKQLTDFMVQSPGQFAAPRSQQKSSEEIYYKLMRSHTFLAVFTILLTWSSMTIMIIYKSINSMELQKWAGIAGDFDCLLGIWSIAYITAKNSQENNYNNNNNNNKISPL